MTLLQGSFTKERRESDRNSRTFGNLGREQTARRYREARTQFHLNGNVHPYLVAQNERKDR